MAHTRGHCLSLGIMTEGKEIGMSSQTDFLFPDPPSRFFSLGRKSFLFYRNATFLSLMIAYGALYLTRQNLGIAFIPMKEGLGITAVEFGWINSIGTFAYAFGKVALGPLADSKLGGKLIFYISLLGSALFCFLFGFGKGMAFFLIAWSCNRFLQSMGWSGLINVMCNWFPQKNYGTAMGIMSLSYQCGAALVTLYMGLLLSVWGGWEHLFFIPALTLAGVGLLVFPFLISSPDKVGFHIDGKSKEVPAATKPTIETVFRYRDRFRILLSNKPFLGMLGLSFILTFLRECFSVWMPAYFFDMGETASVAAIKSTVFLFLGCLGSLAGGYVSDRFLSGRRSPIMACLMGILILCLLGLSHLDMVVAFGQEYLHGALTRSRMALILVGAAGFFLLGSYSFVGGVVALDFGKHTAGTAAGLLDGVGYLGATIAGVGVANIIVHAGWDITFMTLAGCTLVGILLCLGLWHVQPCKEVEE